MATPEDDRHIAAKTKELAVHHGWRNDDTDPVEYLRRRIEALRNLRKRAQSDANYAVRERERAERELAFVRANRGSEP